MAKKILCIEITPLIPNLGRYIVMPRYGLLTIASIISEKTNHEVQMIFEPYVGTIDINKIIEYDADYILLNGLTTSGPQNRFLIENLRKKSNKQFIVISGGEHACMFEDFVTIFSDYIILYEGDEAIIDLLDALDEEDEAKREVRLRNISGLMFKDSRGNWHKSNIVKRVKHIDYRYNFDILKKSRNVGGKLPLTTLPLQISRGCTYHCSFCTWMELYGKKGYVTRPIKDVLHDIVSLPVLKVP